MNDRRTYMVGAILLTVVLLGAACRSQEAAPLPGCEGAPRPIVFVHGMMGSGDSYALTMMRFASNGYCPAYLRAFDWNTLTFDMEGHAEALDGFVDRLLQETGAKQIDLVGHSMGGRLGQTYLAEKQRAAKVAHYVHAASFCDLESPHSVPSLVLSSDEDTIVGACTIAGATNQDIQGADHLQMVTLPEVFAATFRFFNADTSPATTEVIAEDAITLSGRAVTFGTNQPLAGATVEVYPVDAATGERRDLTPVGRFTASTDGAWGPFQAAAATYYEFLVSQEGERPVHYYYQPFTRSNPVVYLRVLPENDLLLKALLGEMRYDDRSSFIVLFSANQALYHGRDTATLDGVDLATPEMAPPPPDQASTIAIFILDADGDGQSDGGPVPGPLDEFPFLQGYDAFLDATTRHSVTLTLNGATLHVPTWKADSEGIALAVFE